MRHEKPNTGVSVWAVAENSVVIEDAEQMLALLRTAPTRRVVGYANDRPWVMEFDGHMIQGDAKLIAFIADTGSARKLLDDAWEADMNGDLDAWKALPLRHGPDFSMWVLPVHGEAPDLPVIAPKACS